LYAFDKNSREKFTDSTNTSKSPLKITHYSTLAMHMQNPILKNGVKLYPLVDKYLKVITTVYQETLMLLKFGEFSISTF